jgi:hypothetical protein
LATAQQTSANTSFLPHEHGATAMLLIPLVSAAILAREWRWEELAVLVAAFCTFAAKEPLVVLARQRWIWKRRHVETDAAKTWLIGEVLVLAVCGFILAASWPLWKLAVVGTGVLLFSTLAVVVHVNNRRRLTAFQILSAIALSSTSLITCQSATGVVRPWAWRLWVLCAMQAAAGIFVVHARLEARIAMRKERPVDRASRYPALLASLVLVGLSPFALLARQMWIAAALAVAGAGYLYELHRQKNPASLQMPLTQVGLQALSLSIAYALLVVVGLW